MTASTVEPIRQPRDHAVPCLRCPKTRPTMTMHVDALCDLHRAKRDLVRELPWQVVESRRSRQQSAANLARLLERAVLGHLAGVSAA